MLYALGPNLPSTASHRMEDNVGYLTLESSVHISRLLVFARRNFPWDSDLTHVETRGQFSVSLCRHALPKVGV